MSQNESSLPPRVRAAFDYLYHTWRITYKGEPSMDARELTSLEQSVETTALRTLQQYLLGEMEFADEQPRNAQKADDEKTAESATASK